MNLDQRIGLYSKIRFYHKPQALKDTYWIAIYIPYHCIIMIYFYQVLGKPTYTQTEYTFNFDDDDIDKFKESGLLSSIVTYRNLKESNKKIIFLMPDSLSSKDIKETTIKMEKQDVSYELLTMPSLDAENALFNPNEILLFIFLDMHKRLKKDDKLFIDITTGLNIYVNNLVAAAQYSNVDRGLQNMENDTYFNTILTDPVLDKDKNKQVNVYNIANKNTIFFSMPYFGEFRFTEFIDCEDEMKCRINKEWKETLTKLKTGIVTALRVYNAISRNTPLYLYYIFNANDHYKYDENISDFVNLIMDRLTNDIKNKNRIFRYKIDKIKDLINFIISLDMLSGLKYLITEDQDFENLNKEKFIETRKLLSFSQRLYENRVINKSPNFDFLKRDIDNLYTEYHSNKNAVTSIEPNEYSSNKNDKNHNSSEKRNFFMHSGLEIAYIEYKKIENKTDNGLIKYRERYMDNVEKFLSEKL